MDEEFLVRLLVEEDVSNQPGINALVVVDHVEKGDGTTNFLHGHVLQAVPCPNSACGDHGSSKPAHDVRVHEVAGFDQVEDAQHGHRGTAHDFNPVVEVGFVIKHRESLFDHGISFVAHGLTTHRWDF